MVRGFAPVVFAPFILIALGGAAGAYTLKTIYNFCDQQQCADGSNPAGGLLRDSNGNLFGTTTLGGTQGEGAVFELKRNVKSWNYQVLHSFCSACGESVFPHSKLVLDIAGNLYGAAPSNGELDCGMVFRLSPSADSRKWHMKRLHSFCAFGGDGAQPVEGVTYAGATSGAPYDGISPLYGVTTGGGSNRGGTVYEIRPNGVRWKERVIYSFCADRSSCSDGAGPGGDLLMDAAGSLYGNTFRGGVQDEGTVFKLSLQGSRWREQVLHSFCGSGICSDGSFPQGGLAMDAAGQLFGTTSSDSNGRGTLYRLVPRHSGARERVLHAFCTGDCEDGFSPGAGPLLGSDGSLFGTTETGGQASGGTVYKLGGKTLTTLYSFCSAENCADGGSPQAPVITDDSGNLYGVAFIGGTHNGGTVFEISP